MAYATRLSILILLVLGTASCTTPAPAPTLADPPATRITRPIIDGVEDTNPAHKAVVALAWGSGPDNFCSGTLITPDVVLTAAHCVDKVSVTLLEVFFGNDVDQPGERRGAVEIAHHPLWDSENLYHGYDLGLVRLASPAPADATPIAHLPAGLGLTATDESTALEFVGFGRTETNTSGLKLTAMAIIGGICDGPDPCPYLGTMVAPGAFGYPMDEGGPCKGDSGGPAFLWRNGQEYVAGVTSYGDELCVYFGASIRPDSHAAWIEAFIAGVGEDCATPGDEDADTLADCADPDCDDHPACGPSACLAPQEIGCGDEITDTTEGGTYHLRQYICQTAGLELGPERAYVITAPRGLDVGVTLHPENGVDLDLFVLPYFLNDCAAWDCLGASATAGTTSEQVLFRARTDHGFIVVDSFGEPGSYTLLMTCDTSDEDCTNNIDDDADGDTDCEDADCDAHPDCMPPPEICVGDVDEDGDGLIDCEDPSCADSVLCAPPAPKGGCHQAPAPGSGLLTILLATLLALLRRRH
jgi:Trypsin